jgi:UDP-N-acetyl-2-amino-2-deoxyglucuronate dehydrogenase
MKSLAFAVIGLGNMGKIHAANLFAHRVKNAHLAAVSDTDPALFSWSKNTLPGVPFYPNYQDMIREEDLDAIVVVTPHKSHVTIGNFALSHGLHTLIEKPLAVTALEAEKILEVHKKYPALVSGVAFNQRSNPVYRKAKELVSQLGTIRSGRYEISDWYRPDSYYRMNPWRGTYALEGGGGLINQCHHQLDLIVWLLGLPLRLEAHLKTVNRAVNGENDVLAIFHYPSFDFVFTASLHDLKGINFLDLSGDKGRLNVEKTAMTAYFHEDEALANQEATLYGGVPSEERHYSYGAKRLAQDKAYGQQLHSLQAFADAILGRGEELATLEEGFQDVELLNAIYLSAWSGEEVCLPVNEEAYAKALEARAKKP